MEQLEAVKSLIGEQNLATAFWVVVGWLVLNNITHVVKGIFETYKWKLKVNKDLNEAFRLIKELKASQKQGEEK